MCNLKKKERNKIVFSKKKNQRQIERLLHKRKRFLDKFFSSLKEPYLSLSLSHVDRGSSLFFLRISELSKDRPTSKYAG